MQMKNWIRRYADAFSGLPGRAWWMALVVLVNRSGGMVFFFLPLYLTSQKGFSVVEAGRMVSVWGLGSLAGSYIGGWLSDRLGTKAVQAASLAASGAGFIVLGFLDGPAVLTAAVFLVSLLSESFRPANITAFAEACGEERRARGFTLLRLANNLGFAVGPVLGGFFAASGCYACLFWADGLTSLAAAAVMIRLPGGGRSASRPGSASKSGPSVLRDGRLLAFLGFLFCVTLMFCQIFGTWSLYLKNVRGLAESRIGLLMTVNALMIVLMEMPLMKRIERENPLRFIRFGTVLVALAFASLPWMGRFALILAATAVMTTGEMMIFSPSSSWVAGRVTEGRTGSVMGLYSLTFSMALVVAPAAGTWSYDRLGPDGFWPAVGGFGLMAAAGFSILYRKGNGKSAQPGPAEPVEAVLTEL
ncbi:MAG: MFS transporter [bacterium]|nr:MFS transporter [bacterium]